MKKSDLNLLGDLMRLRPVTADVDAVNRAVDLMAEYLRGHGLHLAIESDGGRKVLYASTREGRKPALLLNTHLDVVPAIREDQYELTEKDGWLVGRGTADCLGHSVIAARFLIDHARDCDAGVVFSTDEEFGGSATGRMVELGYGASRVILVVDSGFGSIAVAQKGILVLKVTAKGKGGHSAYPWVLDNPIDTLVTGCRRLLRGWRNPAEEEDWRDSMELCQISGGFATNQVPDSAEAIINFRYIKDSHRERIIGRVKRVTGCEVEIVRECPPVDISPEHPELRMLQEIMSRHFPKIGFSRSCGATDARYFRVCGVPIGMIGAKMRGVHGHDEAVELASLEGIARSLDDFSAAVAVD